MYILLAFIVLLYIVMIAVTIKYMYRLDQKKYTVAKTATSIGFLAIGLISYIISGQDIYLAFLPAYLFCLVGDVLLALCNEIENKLKNPQFTLGVVSFAFAHIFIIREFGKILSWKISPFWIVFSAGLLIYTIITVTLKKEKFCYGSNAVPSCIYAAVVGLCGGMGLDIIWNLGDYLFCLVLGAGSVFFMISDFILANKYFRISKKAWFGGAVMIFYYGAMGMLSIFTVLI